MHIIQKQISESSSIIAFPSDIEVNLYRVYFRAYIHFYFLLSHYWWIWYQHQNQLILILHEIIYNTTENYLTNMLNYTKTKIDYKESVVRK